MRFEGRVFGNFPKNPGEPPCHDLESLSHPSATIRPDKAFRDVLESDGTEVIRVGPRAPNLNAFAERWVLSIKSECLDHFVWFGESHLRHIVNEYLAHYNESRPHQ